MPRNRQAAFDLVFPDNPRSVPVLDSRYVRALDPCPLVGEHAQGNADLWRGKACTSDVFHRLIHIFDELLELRAKVGHLLRWGA